MAKNLMFSKRIKKFFLYAYIILDLLIRFFTNNLYGIFLLVLLCYFLSPYVTGIKPLTFSELITLLSEQSETTKGLLLSSTITVIGFLIAFQSATKNWKDQLRANLRVEASKDIDLTYSRIAELILSIRTYADTNLNVLEKIKNNAPEIELFSGIQFAVSQTQKFLADRQELSMLHIRSYGIYGKYSSILFSTLGSYELLDRINESVKNVTTKMWTLVPMVDLKNPDYCRMYLSSINENELIELSIQCNKSHPYISGWVGNIRGRLTANIIEFNFSLFYNFLRKGNFFLDLWESIKKMDEKSSERNQNPD